MWDVALSQIGCLQLDDPLVLSNRFLAAMKPLILTHAVRKHAPRRHAKKTRHAIMHPLCNKSVPHAIVPASMHPAQSMRPKRPACSQLPCKSSPLLQKNNHEPAQPRAHSSNRLPIRPTRLPQPHRPAKHPLLRLRPFNPRIHHIPQLALLLPIRRQRQPRSRIRLPRLPPILKPLPLHLETRHQSLLPPLIRHSAPRTIFVVDSNRQIRIPKHSLSRYRRLAVSA